MELANIRFASCVPFLSRKAIFFWAVACCAICSASPSQSAVRGACIVNSFGSCGHPNYDALHKNGIVKFVSSKARAASRRQPRESSSTSPKRSAARAPSTAPTTAQPPAAPGTSPSTNHSQQLSRAAERRLWRCAKHQQRCSQHACRALIHDRSQCPTPLRADLPFCFFLF